MSRNKFLFIRALWTIFRHCWNICLFCFSFPMLSLTKWSHSVDPSAGTLKASRIFSCSSKCCLLINVSLRRKTKVVHSRVDSHRLFSFFGLERALEFSDRTLGISLALKSNRNCRSWLGNGNIWYFLWTMPPHHHHQKNPKQQWTNG